ncbi:hypothetical protein B0H13DRAFT_1865931 [Mycena leptocephala]|nr:hypothetical protein B0H13DRAFT_1865931 [Mycena leptocephala]
MDESVIQWLAVRWRTLGWTFLQSLLKSGAAGSGDPAADDPRVHDYTADSHPKYGCTEVAPEKFITKLRTRVRKRDTKPGELCVVSTQFWPPLYVEWTAGRREMEERSTVHAVKFG